MATIKKIKISSIKPLHADVIVRDMKFLERFTSGGIIIPSDDKTSAGVRPRWGKVFAVGPEQTDVKVGEYVLVSHGRWTRGINVIDDTGESFMIQKIDPKDILLVSDSPVKDETFSDCVY